VAPVPRHDLSSAVSTRNERIEQASRTRQKRLYDASSSHVTNIKAPTGSDLSIYTEAHLHVVENKLNLRPRKTLLWATPADVLATHLRF